jgi:hypothetical protein
MSVITGKENIQRFNRSRSLSGLAIEIVTGMVLSSRGSGLQACQIHGLLPEGRTTKKAGLKKAVKAMKELYPDWEVPKSVQTALDK